MAHNWSVDPAGREAWDDLVAPLIGRNIDLTTGRISFDYAELTVDFATNARYTEEPVAISYQMPHAWKEGTGVRPHLHWLQTEDHDPNWMIVYRAYGNGTTPGAFTPAKAETTRVFTYTSGTILQITKFPEIAMTGLTVSAFVDIRLYRDSANSSTLFSGADPYTVTAKAKNFDIHVLKSSPGSAAEYVK